MISAVLMVRTEATAEDSFAAMRARKKFGIAIAAIIRMIATTINNSIKEKPIFVFRDIPMLPSKAESAFHVSNVQFKGHILGPGRHRTLPTKADFRTGPKFYEGNLAGKKT